MIFDSPEMVRLRNLYAGFPDYLSPDIVVLDRSEKFEGERIYLQDIFATVDQIKQRDWIGRLVNYDHKQFLGAWFEMMLVGWCKDFGTVEVEPNIKGNFPDIFLTVCDQSIVIEARALAEPEREINESKLHRGLIRTLQCIKKPYIVDILAVSSSQFPDLDNFKYKVENWLDNLTEDKFIYNDGKTIVVLKKRNQERQAALQVQVVPPIGQYKNISSKPIKESLKEKLKQHKTIKTEFPYVIALLLESSFLSPEEVVEAWFGKETFVVDINEMRVVDSYIDRSGIHFRKNEICNTSVSGTLVFQAEYDKEKQRHYLISRYIQNPYARIPLSTELFPVAYKFIELDRNDYGIRMGWEIVNGPFGKEEGWKENAGTK